MKSQLQTKTATNLMTQHQVILNPHLLRKMDWSRQFRKWCNLLIMRAEIIE